MEAKYESLGTERFTVEYGAGGQLIRIPARRQIFVLLFLSVWLCGWTVGGFAALYALFAHFSYFLVFWLCGWALGWCLAAGTVAWMLGGSETVRVIGTDLELGQHVFGYSRRWLYQGQQIRNLSAAGQAPWPFQSQFQWNVPFFRTSRFGSVKFDYGPRTTYFAPGLDEAEARLIVDRLAKSLPSGAVRS